MEKLLNNLAFKNKKLIPENMFSDSGKTENISLSLSLALILSLSLSLSGSYSLSLSLSGTWKVFEYSEKKLLVFWQTCDEDGIFVINPDKFILFWDTNVSIPAKILVNIFIVLSFG